MAGMDHWDSRRWLIPTVLSSRAPVLLGLLGLLTACTAGRPPSEPAKPAASGLPPQATAPANTGSGNQDVASPANGGPRNWQVSQGEGQLALREAASASAKVLSTYPAGTILDNLGCQPGEGGMWCDVQPLGGGPRGFVPATRLRPAVSPDGRVARGPDDSALRAGQGKFDANGTLPCAQELGQPMGPCSFAVARAGGGYATVVITKPEGGTRAIHFRLGRAIGADTSEADASGPFHLKREQDLNLIRVGKERYEIPDAVVLGG